MIAASRRWLRSFSLWLSLGVVLTCALCSFGSPVRASTGSAFNAFTRDVAIGPKRAGKPEKHRRQRPAPSGGAGQALLPAPAAIAFEPACVAIERALAAPAAILLPFVTAGPLGARAPPSS